MTLCRFFVLLTHFVLLKLRFTHAAVEERSAVLIMKENTQILGNVIGFTQVLKVVDEFDCGRKCTATIKCLVASYAHSLKLCSLIDRTVEPKDLFQQHGTVIFEKLVKPPPSNNIGISKGSAVQSCQHIKNQAPNSRSGLYWIDVDGGDHDNAFQVYCDMETEGGGWTLVWSYTFTSYDHFIDGKNAVTPRPAWSVKDANVPQSTTVPLGELDYNAMPFGKWKSIGKEFLVKSNINNWIKCSDDSGSLLKWYSGSIDCKMVKAVSNTCTELVPNAIVILDTYYGPLLVKDTGQFYYFDGSTIFDFPVHSPCADSLSGNDLRNAENPHGNIFIR